MISIGPFSTRSAIVILALLVAWLLARQLAKRQTQTAYKEAGALVLDAAFWGLLSARLAYLAQWWEDYATRPWSMLAVGDGGFTWWLGLPVALIYLWRKSRPLPDLRRPVLAGVGAGIVVWALAQGVLLAQFKSAPPLPDVALTMLDERPVSLSHYGGKPVVLNLWASWCPPCRREMPAFAQAQHDFPNINVVLVNQGESAQQAQSFLKAEGLHLNHVLVDPTSLTLRAVQSRGLPTTLFFNADGHLVDAHLGEITLASLKDKVLRHFGQSAGDPPLNKD